MCSFEPIKHFLFTKQIFVSTLRSDTYAPSLPRRRLYLCTAGDARGFSKPSWQLKVVHIYLHLSVFKRIQAQENGNSIKFALCFHFTRTAGVGMVGGMVQPLYIEFAGIVLRRNIWDTTLICAR